jgi:uncharacterized protein DUF5372
VTITHPFHPLRGQQVEVILIRRGRDPDLIIRLPDGLHAAVAMSSTDYASPPEGDLPSGPAHLLDFDGLRQMVQLIDHLHQTVRYPQAEADAPCPPTEPSYD